MTTRPPTDLLEGAITFILRLSIDDSRRVTGVAERVKTGEKERFHGIDSLSPLIARMVGDQALPDTKGDNR